MIDNGYMIIMSLILIILGIIIMHLYRRVKLLENSILQHGKVLQSFMINQISNNNTKTVDIDNTDTINSNNNDIIVNDELKVINNKIDISEDEDEDEVEDEDYSDSEE